jgi:hypothetical protein
MPPTQLVAVLDEEKIAALEEGGLQKPCVLFSE